MYLFLINPEAGGKRFEKIQKRIEALLERMAIKYKFVLIENLADISELLELHLKPNVKGVAAVGGNATVNAIINAMVSEDIPLALVPLSRTNHLAHSLGIKSWDQAIRMLATGEQKNARLGKIGSHYFIGSAEIASHHNIISKYLKRTNIFAKFFGLRQGIPVAESAVAMKLVLDDQLAVEGQIHGMRIDLLENSAKKLQIEILAHDTDKKLSKTILTADELTAESEKKMPVVVGNETIAHTPIEIKGISKHIKLIVPKGSI